MMLKNVIEEIRVSATEGNAFIKGVFPAGQMRLDEYRRTNHEALMNITQSIMGEVQQHPMFNWKHKIKGDLGYEMVEATAQLSCALVDDEGRNARANSFNLEVFLG